MDPSSSSAPDAAGFTRRFVAHQSAFHGFLVSVTFDRHAADDLVQELAVRMWNKYPTYDPARPFVAWGIGFARLLAMEWRRKQARLPMPVDEATLEALVDRAADRADTHEDRRDALRGCIARLTDHQRKILHARYHEEQTVRMIAEASRRTEMSVYKVLNRAHQLLFDCMRDLLARPHPAAGPKP
jgi:RNA polymerase sigma-70 factor (ECF subfamily)